MLSVSGIMREPYLGWIYGRAQVIDVPAGSFGNFQMMSDSGSETSGTEGAADVNIVTGPGFESAEFSDFNPLIGKTPHDKSICTGQIAQFLLCICSHAKTPRVQD